MEVRDIEKALQDLAKVAKDNEAVDRVKVEITLKKPKTKQGQP